MGDIADGQTLIIQNFSKGLQSRNAAEQLSTVVDSVSLIKRYPFAQLVNSIVVRLADAFVSGGNELRCSISSVLGQMGDELLLVFSCNEVTRRLLIVTHSNDSRARAHTLSALAAVAPIAKENKEVHDVVVSSLSSHEEDEFNAACDAVAAYASLSTDFSATIMAQLSDYLLSSTVPIGWKMRLASSLGRLRADHETTRAAIALGATLVDSNTHLPFLAILLSSLNSIAINCRSAISDLLGVLLSVVGSSDGSSPLAFLALSSLRRLARYAHLWTKDHLQRLIDSRLRMLADEEAAIVFLDILATLSRRRLGVHLSVLQDTNNELSALHAHENGAVRVAVLCLAANLSMCPSSPIAASSLLPHATSLLSSPLPMSCLRKLARVTGRLLGDKSVSDVDAVAATSTLSSVAVEGEKGRMLLDLFCLLAQARASLCPPLANWAIEAMKDPSLPRGQLAFLIFPPFVSSAATDASPFLDLPFDVRYQVARAGFRNGHWRSLSRPLLYSISNLNGRVEVSGWMEALREVASSEPIEFTLGDMARRIGHLRRARQIMQAFTRTTSPFRLPLFALRWTETAEKTVLAQQELLSCLSLFLPSSSQLRECSPRVRSLLQYLSPRLHQVAEEWRQLYRRSFHGDEATLEYISLSHASFDVLLHGVDAMAEGSFPSLSSHPTITQHSVVLEETSKVVKWADSSIQQLYGRKDITGEMLLHFSRIFSCLYLHRVCLPRCFFESGDTRSMQLSVWPSGADGELSVVGGVPVPLRVDGVVAASILPILSATIVATVHFYSGAGKDFTQTREVVMHDGVFFSAQFLFRFTESVQIDFSVQFVDGVKKRNWISDASTTLKVDING